jgi:hypothetical protein
MLEILSLNPSNVKKKEREKEEQEVKANILAYTSFSLACLFFY